MIGHNHNISDRFFHQNDICIPPPPFNPHIMSQHVINHITLYYQISFSFIFTPFIFLIPLFLHHIYLTLPFFILLFSVSLSCFLFFFFLFISYLLLFFPHFMPPSSLSLSSQILFIPISSQTNTISSIPPSSNPIASPPPYQTPPQNPPCPSSIKLRRIVLPFPFRIELERKLLDHECIVDDINTYPKHTTYINADGDSS